MMDIEGCRWRCRRCRRMHLVSLESVGFRNLHVNRYTTDYYNRPYILLSLSGHGQLECDDVQGASHTRREKTSG